MTQKRNYDQFNPHAGKKTINPAGPVDSARSTSVSSCVHRGGPLNPNKAIRVTPEEEAEEIMRELESMPTIQEMYKSKDWKAIMACGGPGRLDYLLTQDEERGRGPTLGDLIEELRPADQREVLSKGKVTRGADRLARELRLAAIADNEETKEPDLEAEDVSWIFEVNVHESPLGEEEEFCTPQIAFQSSS